MRRDLSEMVAEDFGGAASGAYSVTVDKGPWRYVLDTRHMTRTFAPKSAVKAETPAPIAHNGVADKDFTAPELVLPAPEQPAEPLFDMGRASVIGEEDVPELPAWLQEAQGSVKPPAWRPTRDNSKEDGWT
jgi:hypothetical protein